MYLTRNKLRTSVWIVMLFGVFNVFKYSMWNSAFIPNEKLEKRSAVIQAYRSHGSLESKSIFSSLYIASDDSSLDRQVPNLNLHKQTFVNNTELFGKTLSPMGNFSVKCRRETYVIAIVTSLPFRSRLRQAIRETWANATVNDARKLQVVFVTGRPRNNSKVLFRELEQYGDIVIGDFPYEAKVKTIFPVLLGFKWALENCQSFQYVYVGFDDTVLNYKRLLERLDYSIRNEISDDRSWIGQVTSMSHVQRNPESIFYVSYEQYQYDYFPPFCTEESAFVITRRVANETYESAKTRKIFPISDAFMGTIAYERNWTLVSDDSFTRYFFHHNPCYFIVYVTMSLYSEKNLTSSWQDTRNKSLLLMCPDPDLDIVLPKNVNNEPFLGKVLTYRLNNPRICYRENGTPLDIFLLVLVSTPPDHSEARVAIRETWCKDKRVLGETVRCVFVMGSLYEESDDLKLRLQQEELRYGDIIQANFTESFRNLTLKVILGLKWITENCQHAKYFYKGDDDMFVNFVNIITYIKSLRSKGMAKKEFFLGSLMFSSVHYSPNVPEHDYYERYHVSDELYYGAFYPPYCSGGGYVMSTDTVPNMYRESMRTPIINVDDAFQGILTKRLGFGPTHHDGFKNWGGKMDTCSLRSPNLMTIHGIGRKVGEQFKVWNAYMNATANCTGFDP
ncbi:uncharacterized protein [Diadema setosum]|uniref:uncharacterized protein n=1 Tax=Diadema setosum TaxID=31175 RepID=UPI003B3B6840